MCKWAKFGEIAYTTASILHYNKDYTAILLDNFYKYKGNLSKNQLVLIRGSSRDQEMSVYSLAVEKF